MNIQNVKTKEIKPFKRNAKKHDMKQVQNVAESIRQFGFVQPIVLDCNNEIVIGHCRFQAAKLLDMTEVPCFYVEDLSAEQVDKLRLLDNKLNESAWDFELLAEDIPTLDFEGFDIKWLPDVGTADDWFENRERYDNGGEHSDEYNEFLDKFEQKRTTDDCYTPDNIYEAVVDYVAKYYKLDRSKFFRPFYPGGNYQAENYDGKIVVDNPPFSILTEIVKWYQERQIPFFMFGPTLTLMGTTWTEGITAVFIYGQIVYENGAQVNTSFVTNMEPGVKARSAPDLCAAITEQNKLNERKLHVELPEYEYPDEVATAAIFQRCSRYGVEFSVKADNCQNIRQLDAQKEADKAIFGSGLLLSEKAAAEKAAAEKVNKTVWPLSDREKEIVKNM